MSNIICLVIAFALLATTPVLGADQKMLRVGFYDKNVAYPEINRIEEQTNQKVKAAMEGEQTAPSATSSISAPILATTLEEQNNKIQQIKSEATPLMIQAFRKLKRALEAAGAEKYDMVIDKGAVLFSEVETPSKDLTAAVQDAINGAPAEGATKPLAEATNIQVPVGVVNAKQVKALLAIAKKDSSFTEELRKIAAQKKLKLIVDTSGISYTSPQVKPTSDVLDLTSELLKSDAPTK